MDIGTYEEILATREPTVEGIRAHIGADSLAYLSHDGMVAAVKEGAKNADGQSGHCTACFSGEYPVEHDF